MPENSYGMNKEDLKRRVGALPKDYQEVFYETTRFLWKFGSNNAELKNLQNDILDMFEAGSQEGKDVFDITGRDIFGFCDGLLSAISERSLVDEIKLAMNRRIYKKLGRKMDDGK